MRPAAAGEARARSLEAAAGPAARGTRPANRRALIVAAAADLFAERGFDAVGVGDIAAAVGVGASALYRHFPAKDAMLVAAIDEALTGFAAAIECIPEQRGTLDADALVPLLDFAARHPRVGVLWQREARALLRETRAPLRARMREILDDLAGRLCEAATAAARIRVSVVVSVLFSQGFRSGRPACPQAVLASLALAVARVEVPDGAERRPPTPGLGRSVRREIVLDRAARLFARGSFARVGMDDVAAAAGVAVSTVYDDFGGKQDILARLLARADGYVQTMLTDVLATSRTPSEAVRELTAGYARYVLAHPDLTSVLIAEQRHLPPEAAAAVHRAQHDFVVEWTLLVARMTEEGGGVPAEGGAVDDAPERAALPARVVVDAVLMVVHDLARNAELRRRADALSLILAFTDAIYAQAGRP